MHVYETKHPIAHSADDMFALVADVESYPKFLPLCEALTLKRREQRDGKEVLTATMRVGYKLIRESFTTEVVLDPAARTILVHYLDGPFAFLENRWQFLPITRGVLRDRFLYPLQLPLAPVRAADRHAVRQGGAALHRRLRGARRRHLWHAGAGDRLTTLRQAG